APPSVDNPARPLLISYTSGTTSFPKGALVTERGMVTNARLFGERLGLGLEDVYYCPVPLFHIAGLVFILLASITYGTSVVTEERFTAGGAWAAIQAHGCTVTGGFEATFHTLVDAVPSGAVSGLRAAWWGGGPPALFNRIEDELGPRLMNVYGLTECSG